MQWRHDDEDVAYPTFELISKHADRRKRGASSLPSSACSPCRRSGRGRAGPRRCARHTPT